MAYTKPVTSNSSSKFNTGASSARPSNGGTTGKMVGKDGKEFDTSTTHYMKDTNKAFVDIVQIWENESQFGGTFQKVVVNETLPAGTYYISKKKDKSESSN